MAKKNLLGFTGNRVGYNDVGDNNWAQNINSSLKTIANNLDRFEYGISDIARETEAAAGRRFQELQDALAEFVTIYLNKLETEDSVAITNLKTYVSDRLADVAKTFIIGSQNDLATTVALKGMIENQITFIDTSIQYLKSDFDYNLNKFTTKIDEARTQRNDQLTGLKDNVDKIGAVLTEHIANKKNPHETKLSQLANSATVYQMDKDNSTSLIEKPFKAASKKVTVDNIDPINTIDSNALFLGKFLGLGDYYKNITTGLIHSHYYLSFHGSLSTLIDSTGDTATYIVSGKLIIITWDVSSTKYGTVWEIGLPSAIERLALATINVKSANSLKSIRREDIFVLYFATFAYPNLLALFMGIINRDVYVSDGSDSSLNWSVDIQNTPADWGGSSNPFNTGFPPDYWIQLVDVAPAVIDRYSIEGAYETPPPDRWTASSYSIETSGFVSIGDLGTFDWWGFDANGIYIKAKFSGNTITFIYNMFERVHLPLASSSSSSTGDPDNAYETIPTNSNTVEVTWTFPNSAEIEVGDIINVTTKRRRLQTGATVPSSSTAGTFTVTTALRYNGVTN